MNYNHIIFIIISSLSSLATTNMARSRSRLQSEVHRPSSSTSSHRDRAAASHRSRERDRHQQRSRLQSPSPRRDRDISIQRNRRLHAERQRERPISSSPQRRQVQFRPAVDVITPHRAPRPTHQHAPRRAPYRAIRQPQQRSRRRESIAARLGPQPEQNPHVRVIQRAPIHVLRFMDVPKSLNLHDFLNLVGRQFRSVTGCTREFNYITEKPGENVYVYLTEQEEIDAAVGLALQYEHDDVDYTMRCAISSATITSLTPSDIHDDSISSVPTVMLRNLTSISTKSAIAAVMDAVQIVGLAHPGVIITHVRVPSTDLSNKKTASLAFVGVSKQHVANELDGKEFVRVAKKIPIAKSNQSPVLVPTAVARERRDNAWVIRAARLNALVIRPNPFA